MAEHFLGSEYRASEADVSRVSVARASAQLELEALAHFEKQRAAEEEERIVASFDADVDEDPYVETYSEKWRRLIKATCGSESVMWMSAAWALGLLWVCIEADQRHETAPWSALFLFWAASLGGLYALLLWRAFWVHVIVKRIFRESRVIPFLAAAFDLNLWPVLWSIMQLSAWQGSLKFQSNGDVTLSWIPNNWKYTEMSPARAKQITTILVICLLWAVRSMLVDLISLRLSISFVMNMSKDLHTYLTTYSLFRRLNHFVELDKSERFRLHAQRLRERDRAMYTLSKKMNEHDRDSEWSKERIGLRQTNPQMILQSLREASSFYLDATPAENIESHNLMYHDAHHVARRLLRTLPRQLQPSQINKLLTSGLVNLVALWWITENPLSLYVDGELKDIRSRSAVLPVVESFFWRCVAEDQTRILPPLEHICIQVEGQSQASSSSSSEVGSSPRALDGGQDDPASTFSVRLLDLVFNEAEKKQFLELLGVEDKNVVDELDMLQALGNLERSYRQLQIARKEQLAVDVVIKRLMSTILTIVLIVFFLMAQGVAWTAIFVCVTSILGLFSAVLNYLYTDFVQSMMWIFIFKPYRYADRVRIDGDVFYVRRITTYFTEFETSHGRVVYQANKKLMAKKVINEDRTKATTIEIKVHIAHQTTPAQIEELKTKLTAYLDARPHIWKRNGLFLYISEIALSQYIEVTIYAKNVRGGKKWSQIRYEQSDWFLFLIQAIRELKITYELPVQRWVSVPKD